MRQGLGLVTSLLWSGQRFGQRAIVDLVAHQRGEFILNAGATVEHLAKAVVADRHLESVFEARAWAAFGPHERAVLDGTAGVTLTRDRVAVAVARVADGRTISARTAAREVRDTCGVPLDVEAAGRVLDARNAAVHLAHSPVGAELDSLCADFLLTAPTLWQSLGRLLADLWGNLAGIAETRYLSEHRSPEDDARLRVTLARRNWLALGVHSLRRAQIGADLTRHTCPACRNTAVLTMQSPGSAPGNLVDPAEPHLIPTLDCFHCGLELYGERQLQSAEDCRIVESRPWTLEDLRYEVTEV